MVTKTSNQETDRAGERLVRSILEPLGWVVNDVQEDYCIDSNVQVFDGESPNGAWFHVQLKSSLSPDYSADGAFISHSLRIDHAKHFALELRQPMFLLIADVTKSSLFWSCPQLDLHLLKQLRTGQQAETITVRISTAQLLPDSTTVLLSALRNIYNVLANRELANSRLEDFAQSLEYILDKEQLRAEMQSKTDVLKLQRIVELYREGNNEAALERADTLIRDPDSSIETKFWALVQADGIGFDVIARSDRPQLDLVNHQLQNALKLQQLTRKGPRRFKFYALLARKSAQLGCLTHENFSLSMLQKAHLQKGGDPFLVWGIYARRAWLAKSITANYNQCVRLARLAARSTDLRILGRALPKPVAALATYVATLYLNGEGELESAFSESALQVSKLAACASRETEDDSGLAYALLSSILVVRSEESETYKWANQMAREIADPALREDVLRGLERATRRWKGEKLEGDIRGDLVWQAVQNIASYLGIDISDEHSPFVRALKVAVRDYSPDRVLRDCDHLLVSHGAIGPMALEVNELFNMKTACSKVVHCTLHDFHLEEKELDSAYEQFRLAYCSKCKDQSPRPPEWSFSGIPTPKEADFLCKLMGTQYDMRRVDAD